MLERSLKRIVGKYTVCGLAVVHGLLQVDKIYSDNRGALKKK